MECCRALIEHGADTTITDKTGETPYDCAYAGDQTGVMELLSQAPKTATNEGFKYFLSEKY